MICAGTYLGGGGTGTYISFLHLAIKANAHSCQKNTLPGFSKINTLTSRTKKYFWRNRLQRLAAS